MSDNWFLAKIERQGEIQNAHEFILSALEENFRIVPEEIRARVRSITDVERLRTLGRTAVRSDNLQAFLDQMDLTPASPGG